MTLTDFQLGISMFPTRAITAFLQGGLAVTGTWSYLNPSSPTAIIIEADGARHVVPIDAITSLREVPVLTGQGAKRPSAVTDKPRGIYA